MAISERSAAAASAEGRPTGSGHRVRVLLAPKPSGRQLRAVVLGCSSQQATLPHRGHVRMFETDGEIEPPAASLTTVDGPSLITQALGVITRSRKSQRTRPTSRDEPRGPLQALSAEGNPSFATVFKLSKALGLKVHFEPVP